MRYVDAVQTQAGAGPKSVASLYRHAHLYACVHVCEGRRSILPPFLVNTPPCVFETGSLIEPGACLFVHTVWPASPRDSSCL